MKKSLTLFSFDILALLSHNNEDTIIDLSVAKCIVNVVKSLIKDSQSQYCLKATDVISREIVKLQSKIPIDKRNVGFKKLTSSEVCIVKYLNVYINY